MRCFILALVIGLVTTVPTAFGETADDAFQKGLAAYQKRDYPAARDAFTAAVASGAPTARLLHNLALTHYQMNQKAYALAYWRKALAIDPNFAAARVGRELLEDRMRMRPFENDGFSLALRQTLERVSPFLLSWALALLIAVTGWLALRYGVARATARDEDADGPAFPWGTAAAGLSTMLVATVLGLKLWDGAEARATVVTDKTEVRSLPNAQAVSLFELTGGGEVLVKRAQDGWTQVQKGDGATGWIQDSAIVITTEI